MRGELVAAFARRGVCLHRVWASSKAMHQAVDFEHKDCFNQAHADDLIGTLKRGGMDRQTRKKAILAATLGAECVQSY